MVYSTTPICSRIQAKSVAKCIRLHPYVVEYKLSQRLKYIDLYSTTLMCIRIQDVKFEFFERYKDVYSNTHILYSNTPGNITIFQIWNASRTL